MRRRRARIRIWSSDALEEEAGLQQLACAVGHCQQAFRRVGSQVRTDPVLTVSRRKDGIQEKKQAGDRVARSRDLISAYLVPFCFAADASSPRNAMCGGTGASMLHKEVRIRQKDR